MQSNLTIKFKKSSHLQVIITPNSVLLYPKIPGQSLLEMLYREKKKIQDGGVYSDDTPIIFETDILKFNSEQTPVILKVDPVSKEHCSWVGPPPTDAQGVTNYLGWAKTNIFPYTTYLAYNPDSGLQCVFTYNKYHNIPGDPKAIEFQPLTPEEKSLTEPLKCENGLRLSFAIDEDEIPLIGISDSVGDSTEENIETVVGSYIFTGNALIRVDDESPNNNDKK